MCRQNSHRFLRRLPGSRERNLKSHVRRAGIWLAQRGVVDRHGGRCVVIDDRAFCQAARDRREAKLEDLAFEQGITHVQGDCVATPVRGEAGGLQWPGSISQSMSEEVSEGINRNWISKEGGPFQQL